MIIKGKDQGRVLIYVQGTEATKCAEWYIRTSADQRGINVGRSHTYKRKKFIAVQYIRSLYEDVRARIQLQNFSWSTAAVNNPAPSTSDHHQLNCGTPGGFLSFPKAPVPHPPMQAFLNRVPLPSLRTPSRFVCTLPTTFPAIPPAQPSHLYVVSTPIGNPGDLTLRALTILRTSSIIAAEDTRRTGLLLSFYHARHSQRLVSCHQHNWRSRIPQLLASLQKGSSVALVSDAGTPCISDPGVEVVRAAVEAGVTVVPVPGACAAVAGWVASTFGGGFWFLGFLPRGGRDRTEVVEMVDRFDGGVVLYEAPHRVRETLRDLTNMERGRSVCVAREVTKKWEEFVRFRTIEEAWEYYSDTEPRGEFTIVLGAIDVKTKAGTSLEQFSDTRVDIREFIRGMAREGMPASSIARCVAGATGVPKKLAYGFAVEVKECLRQESKGYVK